jgi:Tfp pilus assembly protein PilF
MILPMLLWLGASLGQQQYERANELFRRQRFSEAAEAVDLAIKEDPSFVPAWTLRGKIAMAYDRFDFARAAFQRAVHLDPNSANAEFMLGFFYYVDNDFAKAFAPLERAFQLDPNDSRALLYSALSQEGLARPDLAERLYSKTIELETKLGRPSAETHTAYGRLLFTLGRNEESAQQVALVLQLDPESRDGNYEAGRLAFEKGDFGKAAEAGEKALRQPGAGTLDRQIHFLLTRAYSKGGNATLAELHRKAFEGSAPTLRR